MQSSEDAAAFLRNWLAEIDAGAPPDAFLKFLPDGPFEEWSYPEAEIRDAAHLQEFFRQTWGMLTDNRNRIETLGAAAVGDGRFQADADVDWTARAAGDQTIRRRLHYRLVVGPGTSSRDPAGQHPKIYRYKITRL